MGPLCAFSLFTFHLPPLLHHTYSSPLPPISILPPPSPFLTSKRAGVCPLHLLRQQRLDHYSTYLQKSPYRWLPLVMNGSTWRPTNSCYGCWQWVGCSVRWSVFHELQWPLLGGWGRLAIVYQVAPCGSRSDLLLVHVNLVCEPCMYVCTFPTSSTSSHFLFPLLYPLPFLTPHSSHPHTNFLTLTLTHSSHSHSPSITLTPHTPHPHNPHTDTENVFCLMVWVLMTDKRNSFIPSHPPTLT